MTNPNTGRQLSHINVHIALTTADALSDSLVHIILHEELLVVVIDGQNSPTLPDIVIQLLHLGFNLQQTPTAVLLTQHLQQAKNQKPASGLCPC